MVMYIGPTNMPNLFLQTLPKVLLPCIAIVALLFAAKRRHLSLTIDVGIQTPKAAPAVVFAIVWVLLVAVEEYLTTFIPAAQAKQWPNYPTYVIAMRVMAIGLLGPIAEELAFRGLLMAWLQKTRVGVIGSIVIAAALWSTIHFQYAWPLLLLIFADGIVLGLARHFSCSLLLPIAMHVAGNLFSIYQSISQ